MSRHIIAVYLAPLTPITLGHEDIVRRAAALFGRLVIAVATAHKTLFTLDEPYSPGGRPAEAAMAT